MAAGTQSGLTDAIRFDLKLLHETWMEFVFPRQRGAENTVLGKWKPQGGAEAFLYRAWSVVGVPIVGLLYPFVLLGYFFRFQTRRINVTAARLGSIGILLLFIILWGSLAALAKFQFSEQLTAGGVTAVVAACGVAIAAALLSYGFWRLGGRITTVLFAYPFAMTAIFLPPVVAGLFSEAVGGVVLENSDSLARWFVFEGPELFGAVDYLVENFERDSFAHVIIWFGVSVPLGWILGIFVTLADLVRPTAE